jgi:hypothetical protein
MQEIQTQRRIYRSTGSALGYFVGGLMFVALMGFFALNTVDDPSSCALAVGGALLGCWPVFRLSRCGVYIEDGGVRVLKPLSSSRLSWSEIAGFELTSYGSCRVKLIHGRSVPIFGIQQTAWDARRGKKDTDEAKQIAQLNALLEWTPLRGQSGACAASR